MSDADSLGAESLVEGQVPRRRERRSQVVAPQRSQVDMPQLPRIRVRAEAPVPEVRPMLAPDVMLSAPLCQARGYGLTVVRAQACVLWDPLRVGVGVRYAAEAPTRSQQSSVLHFCLHRRLTIQCGPLTK